MEKYLTTSNLNHLNNLKKEGTLRDTEIGRKLNNRHKDDVKNMWNRLSKQH